MGSVKPNPCSCILCKKESSHLGIRTHYLRSHGSDSEMSIWHNVAKVKEIQKTERINKYYSEPKNCKECHSVIPYPGTKKFCSHSCSAKFSNREREKSGYTMSASAKESIRNKLSKPSIIKGPFSKIYTRKCKFCNNTFLSPKILHICPLCQHLKYNKNKDQWSFKFNVFDHPNLFDLDLLKKVGWCSFGGKRGGTKNLNGLSRDHKVSVNEAKKNNYDPYYISHPCNCDLIPMAENNKKKVTSSISYYDLIALVNEYDALRGKH